MLSLCQAMLTASVLVAQTLGTIEARRLASVAFAGSAISAQLVGAVGALLLVRKRPSAPEAVPKLVATGFGGMTAGALVCASAVASDSLLGLLFGSAIFGAGGAVALLLRTAAAGVYPPALRARAVAVVAAGGVGGAVVAPLVVRFAPRLVSGDSGQAAAPWIVIAVGAGIAAFVARAVSAGPDQQPAVGSRRNVAIATRSSRRAAMAVCIVAGLAMVAIMSTATLQLHHLGASDDRVATIVAAHYASMFGFAVPFGLLADRGGRRLALLVAATLLAGSGLGLAADPHGYLAFALVLSLVGAGWSGAFVTGTAMLADASGNAARTALVARNDLAVAVSSSGAAFAATALFARGGPETIGAVVAALAIGAIVIASASESGVSQ